MVPAGIAMPGAAVSVEMQGVMTPANAVVLVALLRRLVIGLQVILQASLKKG